MRYRFVSGLLQEGDKPFLLLAGDYPYYRDDASKWEARLRDVRESGLEIVTTYIPWRHHQTHAAMDPDFTGRTQENRDVLRFLRLARDAGLKVIVKPGPFVHGELAFGGLPDFVDPRREPRIEAERDALGSELTWPHAAVLPHRRHALPAPFDVEYGRFARRWLAAVGREVVAPHVDPDGPIVALQLMNEGIYSDSSRAEPSQLGYSSSTLRRYHSFLEERYRDLASYNASHRRPLERWSDARPPLRAEPLEEPRDVLDYLDWSAFQGRIYVEAARLYRSFLLQGGVPEDLPMLFNFNPNGDTYRTDPASNDGWYTRVNLTAESEVAFGSTNWLGVVAGDEQAFRQYVMASTAFRGPAMEQNWGFSLEYFAPYEHVTPSHFESMLAFACGATGMTVYTMIGTRAWRGDRNLTDDDAPVRTNDRGDASSGDYPGSAPVPSTGERRDKFYTLQQMTQYFRSEGPRFARHGPRASVAWGIYPPYAWGGQWLPRGDVDDVLWRPPLRAVPRGSYHGLDSFVETMTRLGGGFLQMDVSREDAPLHKAHALCLSAHEFMDGATQERIATYVEQGGALLLTDVLPDKDDLLRDLRGALATRVFPHEEVGFEKLPFPRPILMDGERVGRAVDFVVKLRPPADAERMLEVDGACAGYARRVGQGIALYLGAGPWRARFSGDDRSIAEEDQRLIERLLRLIGGDELFPARPLSGAGEVVVWQHGDASKDEQQIFVIVREHVGDVTVEFTRPGPRRARATLSSPSQAVHAFAVRRGQLGACYLRGLNDTRGEFLAPRLTVGDVTWRAETPCDLCVTPDRQDALLVSVAHTGSGRGARVHLGASGVHEVPDLRRGAPKRVTSRAAAAGEGR